MDDEVNRIRPIIERLICPVHLVGHSYGAAVAIELAVSMPSKVRSLTAYEPVLFNLLFHDDDLDAASEIWMVFDDVQWLLVDGRYSTATRISWPCSPLVTGRVPILLFGTSVPLRCYRTYPRRKSRPRGETSMGAMT